MHVLVLLLINVCFRVQSHSFRMYPKRWIGWFIRCYKR